MSIAHTENVLGNEEVALKVFVTGATGFIGGAVARALRARGDEVFALVREERQAHKLPDGCLPVIGRLESPEHWLPRVRSADGFVHAAFPHHGTTWRDSVLAEQTFFEHLVEAMAGLDVPVVVTNGTVFLGDSGSGWLSEDAPVIDEHPAAVRARSVRNAVGGLRRGIELRLASFVYGHAGSVFLPILLDHARRTKRSLTVRGHESVRTSALHVDAAAQAYLTVLGAPNAGGTYHAASEEDPSMAAIARAISVAVGPGCALAAVSPDEAAERLDPFTAMFLQTNNRLDSGRLLSLGWHHRGFDSLLWDVAFGSYADQQRGE